MSMEQEIDRGNQGAKRASWMKVHYRDLALKLCEENPGMTVEELAELFLEQLNKHPAYMRSIAIYVMANTRAALVPKTKGGGRGNNNLEANVVKRVAAKAMTALMDTIMPTGKTLAESTGAECTRAGGWLADVGKVVGPKGIVGRKLTEKELRELWNKK